MNALRALLEHHDHIVQEIDGQNDFGEDLYVTFSAARRVTGDTVKIQVKGGVSWRRANGYAVPVEQHADTWSDGNVPVLCVVYDPETEDLYWANATEQLRQARYAGESPSSIRISGDAILDERTIGSFVAEVREYVGRYRGMGAVRAQLAEMAGVTFEPSDQVLHFVNQYGEILIFWQRRGEEYATLLHSDLDWDPQLVSPDLLRFGDLLTDRYGSEEAVPDGLRDIDNTPHIGEVILNMAEAMWLAACFSATYWARRLESTGESDDDVQEHAFIEVDIADRYVLQQIVDRLEVEPELMARSIEALRKEVDVDIDADIVKELATLENDPDVVDEAMSLTRETIEDASFEALRLALFYLVDRVVIGPPSLPLEEQITIVWRILEPSPGVPVA